MPEPSKSFNFSKSATSVANVAGLGISQPTQINWRSSPKMVCAQKNRTSSPPRNILGFMKGSVAQAFAKIERIKNGIETGIRAGEDARLRTSLPAVRIGFLPPLHQSERAASPQLLDSSYLLRQ